MHLKNRFDVGEFAVLVEIEPPKGIDISQMVTSATKVKNKVTAFVVPDMSTAVLRMSAIGGAAILQGKGMDAVMQICCRDRNRLAIQGDMLAAYGCGITNIMAVNGDNISFGDHHQAKAVEDINLYDLLGIVDAFRNGKDMAGGDLTGAPNFFCGSTVNVGLRGDALDAELAEMKKRADAGVSFFITTPVFDLEGISGFLKAVDIRKYNIIPSLMPLKSVGMARYIQRNMKHIHIPSELIDRFQKAPDKLKEGFRILREGIEMAREGGFKGVMIASMGWEPHLQEILES
jgi:methylenetetrahydrofolate reductase (NADPH)